MRQRFVILRDLDTLIAWLQAIAVLAVALYFLGV